MQNLIATTSEVVHYIALLAVHYKPLHEVHLSRYCQCALMVYILSPLVVLIILILSAGCAVKRKWHFALGLIILALLLNWWTESIVVCFPCSKDAQTNDNENLRVLTYNVWNASPYFDEHWKEGAREMVGSIMEVDADIVVLNELYYGHFHKMIDTLRLLYPYSTRSLSGDSFMETQVFSRYPISDFRSIRYEDSSLVNDMSWLASMTLTFPNALTVKLYACHLAANQISNLLPDESISLWDKAKMIYSSMSNAYEKRTIQAEVIRDSLDSCDIPKLVIGDFNDVGGSYTLRHILGKDMADVWWKAGLGYGATYYMHNIYLRLDHILFSESDFKAKKAKVLTDWKYSDHYPIVADLKMCIK